MSKNNKKKTQKNGTPKFTARETKHFVDEISKQVSSRMDRKRSANKSNVRGGIQAPAMSSSVELYTKSLSQPEKYPGAKVPFMVNNVPTINSITAQTRVEYQFTIAAAGSAEIMLFPGHGTISQTEPEDLVSAHAQQILCAEETVKPYTANGLYTVGPLSSTVAPNNLLGIVTTWTVQGISLFRTGYNSLQTDATNLSCKKLVPPALPYTRSTSSGHTRWRLVSQEWKLINRTAKLARDGSVVAQSLTQNFNNPSTTTNAHYDNIDAYISLPTRRLMPGSRDSYRGCFAPLPQDLSYWHDEESQSSEYYGNLGGERIFINTDQGGEWTLMLFSNWEIAGQAYLTVATPSPNTPGASQIVMPALQYARLHPTGFRHFARLTALAKHVAQPQGFVSKLNMLGKAHPMYKAFAAGGFGSALMHYATKDLKLAEPFAKRALGFMGVEAENAIPLLM